MQRNIMGYYSEAMMDREEGTTKYAKGANGKNIGINRRQTQTFSSADLAEENRLALQAGEMIRARRSAGELRMVLNREAIASFRSAGRGAKNPCSRMRTHSAPVCVCLRVSAAKKMVVPFETGALPPCLR